MLYPRRILTNQQLGQILNRSYNTSRMPLQRRFAPTKEPRLVGDDFDKNPITHASMANKRLDFGDLHIFSFIGVFVLLITGDVLMNATGKLAGYRPMPLVAISPTQHGIGFRIIRNRLRGRVECQLNTGAHCDIG